MKNGRDVFHRLIRMTRGGGLRAQLFRGGLGSLVIKLGNTFLGLALVILLARTLGPEGYGIYAYVFALISLLSIPAQFGLPTLLVRETAKTHVNKDWARMLGVWRWAGGITAAFSLTLAIFAGAFAWAFADHFTRIQLTTLAWGLALVPLLALGKLRSAALRGLRKVIQGQLPDSIIRPALLIALISCTLLIGGTLTADRAMVLHVVAAGLAFLIGVWLLWHVQPKDVSASPSPVYDSRKWLATALPLGFIAGMQLINKYADIIMLGIFSSAEDVGIYRVVVQGAMMVAFGLHAMSMVVAPHFARLLEQNASEKLQKTVTFSARIILLLTLPVVAGCVFFGEAIINYLFGSDYTVGYVALSILAVGQLISAIFGSVGSLLIMGGHERDMARGVGAAAVVNVFLNLILIPLYGLNGAALATSISLALWNFLLWRSVTHKLEINSLAFGNGFFAKLRSSID